MSDYIVQTDKLIERFKEKGYKENELEKVRNEVNLIEREDILKQRTRGNENNDVAFITGCRKSIRKYWPILLNDNALKNILPKKHNLFPKEPKINIISKNVLDPPKMAKVFLERNWFFRCRRFKACKTTRDKTRKVETFRALDGKEQKINELITCKTRFVTYMLVSPCGLRYLGRATRCLFIRIVEHNDNIRKGFKQHSVSNHYRLKHNSDPTALSFFGIDRVYQHWR